MKRYLVLLFTVFFIFLTGCSLTPEKSGPTPPAAAAAQDGAAAPAAATAPADTGNASPAKSVETAATGAAAEAVASTKTEGARNTAGSSKIPVTLYYQDSESFLIPMTRWIDKQQGIAGAAVNGLIDSAITREELQYYGVYPVLPVNTDVLGINLKDGIAVIDFNKKLLDCKDAASERIAIVSVVYTLTEFKTISGVRILVNGYPQTTLKYGTDVSGILTRNNTVINSGGTGLKAGAGKADIYLFRKANEGFTYLLPVSVESENTGEETAPETLIKLLLKGNPGEKLLSEMPSGAELIDCTSKGSTLTLNFDVKFTEYGGSAREDGILKQLTYTIRQVKGLDRIKLLISGKNAELPEGTDVSSGVTIPKTINDVIDM